MIYPTINSELTKTKILPTGILTSTRNWLAKAAMLVGATLTVLACQEPGEIGLTPTTPVGVFLSDTFTIRRSTILLDSVQSNGLSGLMVGRYVDPLFGTGKATSFARLGLQVANDGSTIPFTAVDANGTAFPASKIIYDSTKAVLNIESFYYYGDTLAQQKWGIHRLKEDILTTNNYDVRSKVGYEPTPIIQFLVTPRPFAGDSLRLISPFPDAIGRSLLALCNTDDVKDRTKFLALNTKGFAIVSTTVPNSTLLRVTPQYSAVVVYYHVDGETTARSYNFTLTGPRFSNVEITRTAAPLSGLKAGQVLPASATNGRSYVQAFSGVTSKIEFPTLLSLEQNRRVAINRADLVITPTIPNGAIPTTYSIPPYITLAELNGYQLARTSPNRVVQLLPVFPGVTVNRKEASFFNPQTVLYNTRTKNYTLNMTGYIQSMMAGTTPNNGLVLLTPGSSDVSPGQQQFFLNDRMQQLILDGNASVKLVLFFTSSN
jgi:hypothetical protein